MEGLLGAFEERLAEVDTYLDFLQSIEEAARQGPPKLEGADHPISTQQQKILYAGVYLQLYNLVESTMTRCIDSVTVAASEGGTWFPQDLSVALRREWVRVTARTHTELTPEHRLERALALCENFVSTLPITPFSVEKGGGGNWDDLAIEAISTRLGFDISVSEPAYKGVKRPFRDDLGALVLVKNLRNRLAHGSISFSESADDMNVGRFVDLKEKTANYLREVVACFVRYIENHEFIIPDRRPA